MDKIITQLKKQLSDCINQVSGNETYKKLTLLYPQITIKNTLDKIEKELQMFCKFTEIAHLVERYKKNHDYITENEVAVKMISLLSTIDENISFDEYYSFNSTSLYEKFNSVSKEQEQLRVQLIGLGFNNFKIFESEKHKIVPQKDMNDKTYYINLFSQTDDFVELMTLYCINNDFDKGMKKSKLELVHKLLLQKSKSTPQDFQFFSARVRKHYHTLGLTNK